MLPLLILIAYPPPPPRRLPMLPSSVVSVVLSRTAPSTIDGNDSLDVLNTRGRGKSGRMLINERFQIPGWKWAYLKRGDIWHFEGASPSNYPQDLDQGSS
eukprot:scaffold7188_cov116-Skeletonema_marinoi.AAC.3